MTENSRRLHAEQRHRGRDAIVPEATGGDAYRLGSKYPDDTVCRECGAVFEKGRWKWPHQARSGKPGRNEVLCPACRRIGDDYPAGWLTLSGAFFDAHRDDIFATIRAVERLEREEHPMHRVIAIQQADGGVVITTTDIHLPRRIADALEDAYGGETTGSYGPDEEAARFEWRRIDEHAPAGRAPRHPFPVDVRLHGGVQLDPDTEHYLHERIAQLPRFQPRLLAVRVTIDAPGRHHRKGGPYRVDVHVEVPGADAHVSRQEGENLHAAVRSAFNAITRQLEDSVRIRRGDTSPTDRPRRGVVVRLYPARGYGFLAAEDGHEVYFHANSVLDGAFERLNVGAEVRYHEEPGESGPQASSVALSG